MKEKISKLGKTLSKKEQKSILGKGGLAEEGLGVCIDANGQITVVPCDELCDNGTQPICAAP